MPTFMYHTYCAYLFMYVHVVVVIFVVACLCCTLPVTNAVVGAFRCFCNSVVIIVVGVVVVVHNQLHRCTFILKCIHVCIYIYANVPCEYVLTNIYSCVCVCCIWLRAFAFVVAALYSYICKGRNRATANGA